MSRTGWWLVELASRLLESRDREAVRGDLAESSESGARAFGGVLGLVVRRQAALWRDWRPWLALTGVVLLGPWLGIRSVAISRSYNLYLWIARNYTVMDGGLLRQTGLGDRHGILELAYRSLLLAASAWLAGYLVGWLSRRASPVVGTLFCLLLFLCESRLTPRSHYWVNGEEYAASLLPILLPFALTIVLVLPPALWGLKAGSRRTRSATIPPG